MLSSEPKRCHLRPSFLRLGLLVPPAMQPPRAYLLERSQRTHLVAPRSRWVFGTHFTKVLLSVKFGDERAPANRSKAAALLEPTIGGHQRLHREQGRAMPTSPSFLCVLSFAIQSLLCASCPCRSQNSQSAIRAGVHHRRHFLQL